MNNLNTLVYFGEAVKALDDNGRVGGYLIRFSDDGTQKDLTGEWFTSKTYLGPNDGNGSEALFEHGFPVMPKSSQGLDKATLKTMQAFADRTFAPLKTKRDAYGVFAETVLDLADDYEKMIFGLVKQEKLGWSSGAAGHRVVKSKDGEIVRWPIAEGSLTPRPAEPLNRAITLKSLLEDEDSASETAPRPGSLTKRLNQRIDDMVDDGRSRDDLIKRLANEAMIALDAAEQILAGETRPSPVHLKAFSRVLEVSFDSLKNLSAGPKSIKDLFDEALSEQPISRWNLDSVYCGLLSKLVMAASASKLTGVEFDLEGKIIEATDGYAARLKDLALTEAQEYLESGSDEHFYLRAMADPSAEDFINAKNVDIEDHTALVVSALRSAVARFRANHEARVKAGRVLSEKNRQRLNGFIEQALTAVSECQRLLDETQPKASDAEKRLAQTIHERQRWRLRAVGANNANSCASSG